MSIFARFDEYKGGGITSDGSRAKRCTRVSMSGPENNRRLWNFAFNVYAATTQSAALAGERYRKKKDVFSGRAATGRVIGSLRNLGSSDGCQVKVSRNFARNRLLAGSYADSTRASERKTRAKSNYRRSRVLRLQFS